MLLCLSIFIHSLSKTEQTMSLLHDLEGNRGHYLNYCTITFWANTPLLELVFIFFHLSCLFSSYISSYTVPFLKHIQQNLPVQIMWHSLAVFDLLHGRIKFCYFKLNTYNNTLDVQRIIFNFPRWLILVYLHFLFSEIIGFLFIMILNLITILNNMKTF